MLNEKETKVIRNIVIDGRISKTGKVTTETTKQSGISKYQYNEQCIKSIKKIICIIRIKSGNINSFYYKKKGGNVIKLLTYLLFKIYLES